MIAGKPVITTVIFENQQFDVLRLDQLHPFVSGNKWYKLKYNLEAALSGGYKGILTFGGSSSNHIAATAAACAMAGITSVGIIRGEERETQTLQFARAQGMQIRNVSRQHYDELCTQTTRSELMEELFVVPQGGCNDRGIKGCEEILRGVPVYDHVICACGTGATLAGIIRGQRPGEVYIGINVLKGDNRLREEMERMTGRVIKKSGDAGGNQSIAEHTITDNYAFSGYARFEPQLAAFCNRFSKSTGVALDYVYTAKSAFAAVDLLRKKLVGPRVLLVHSGGLQGNADFVRRFSSRFLDLV